MTDQAYLAQAWEQGRLAGFEQGLDEAACATEVPSPPNPYEGFRSAPMAPKLYLTEVPYRNSKTKAHPTIGQAKAALSYGIGRNKSRGGKMWEYGPTGPVLLYDLPPGLPTEDIPWRKKK